MIRLVVSVVFATTLIRTSVAEIEFREVARTGDIIHGLASPIASFGHWVSINDDAQVAFKAELADGTHAIVCATPNGDGIYDLTDPGFCRRVATENGVTRELSDYVAINESGEVSYRLKVSSPDWLFEIKRDSTRILTTGSPSHAVSLMSPTDVTVGESGMVSLYALVEDGPQVRHQIRKGNGVTGCMVRDTLLIAGQPEFTRFEQFTSINDAGMVVFTGSHPTEGTGVFMGQGGQITPVATSASGFPTTGAAPSINDLGHVVFYGDNNCEQGIYIYDGTHIDRNGHLVPWAYVPIRGQVDSVEPDSRVAFNDYDDIAFLGTTPADPRPVQALFIHHYAMGTAVVATLGSDFNRNYPVDALALWDGLNNNDDVAFWAHHTHPSDPTETYQAIHVASCPAPCRLLVQRLWQKHPNWAQVCLGWPRCHDQIKNPGRNCVQNPLCERRPEWPQCDPPSHCVPCRCCNQCTIGGAGCALTCASMLYNYYTGSRITPNQLNEWDIFKNTDAKVTNDINWAKVRNHIVRDTGEPRRYENVEPAEPYMVGEVLCGQNELVTAKVRGDGGRNDYHFVLCYGVDYTVSDEWDQVLIHDPGHPLRTDLGDYRDRLVQLVAFPRCDWGEARAAVYVVTCPAELLLTDREGRQTGYDPVTGELVDEIPGVTYSAECEVDPNDPNIPRSQMNKTAYLTSEVEGVVAVDIIAQEDGVFALQAEGYRETGETASSLCELVCMRAGEILDREVRVPCRGDLDLDGDVDLSDLAQLLSNYRTTGGAVYEDGDLDGDGDVDLADLAALLAVYGTTCD